MHEFGIEIYIFGLLVSMKWPHNSVFESFLNQFRMKIQVSFIGQPYNIIPYSAGTLSLCKCECQPMLCTTFILHLLRISLFDGSMLCRFQWKTHCVETVHQSSTSLILKAQSVLKIYKSTANKLSKAHASSALERTQIFVPYYWSYHRSDNAFLVVFAMKFEP